VRVLTKFLCFLVWFFTDNIISIAHNYNNVSDT